MRIVFMGTPEFALPSLRILLEHNYNIVSVVTSPDKPQGRGQKVSPSPVKELALARDLRLLQPESLKAPDLVSTLAHLQPDLIVVVAFRILPRELFTLPRCGSVNLHASLLPKYRGAAPINWAIINGELETGVTTFFLREKVDTGSIILQARVRIGADETAGELHDRLADLGGEVVLQTVRQIELGTVQPQTQDESLASPAPKIFKEDCRIDWRHPAERVRNRIRGLSPYPAAFTLHAGKSLKIYKARIVPDSPGGAPGTVAAQGGRLFVNTAGNPLEILEVQQEGRRRMGVEEFLRGYKITSGEQLQ